MEKVEARGKIMIQRMLDYVQVAVPQKEQYMVIRGKLLRQYNDFLRDLKEESDEGV